MQAAIHGGTAVPLPDLEAVARLGEAIARHLRPGDAVALRGDLGAGKTTLARAVLAALGHEGDVPSPTFTLVQPYDLRIPAAHLDLYRLKRPEEVEELGFDDLLVEGAALIEWPEMAEDYMPAERLDVHLTAEPAHTAELVGHGRWDVLIAEVARDAEIDAFLARSGWGGATRTKMSGDASTRAYERIAEGGRGAILMNQPQRAETAACPPDATAAQRAALGYNALARLAAGRVDAFVSCARFITDAGLSAPHVLAADAPAGLAVLEDLGDDLYARLIERGVDEAPLYDAAIDALAVLQGVAPPDVLPGGWPLLVYDDLALQTAQDIIVEWWPKFRPALRFDAAALNEWEAIWRPIRARGVAGATVFCHRDYHAENLIWLPEREGAARVGMLDFQDAVRAHPAWDLSMLLHDARRDVSPEREAASLKHYVALTRPTDPVRFIADYHALGALNIVRILGIFARLVTRDGKPRYEAFMPRLWRYLDSCLADPALADLATWFDTHMPQDLRR
jgi:tRNA threonylcarbamoyl adenosine modification protein YjeE